MLNVHLLGDGISVGTLVLRDLIQKYRQHLISVAAVVRNDDPMNQSSSCSFVVVFREPASIGQLTAFVSLWSTTSADPYSGEGPRTFNEMMEFLKEKELVATQLVADFETHPLQGYGSQAEWEKFLREKLLGDAGFSAFPFGGMEGFWQSFQKQIEGIADIK
ncbi:MAG: hypothetical protein KME12_23425 [Trichocoleus desertorum ATA4-8-CV12]|jgi:hypothetical protein|nr:hypothetical protein [Trichocoleus desertorum ATA4-8-CV12]